MFQTIDFQVLSDPLAVSRPAVWSIVAESITKREVPEDLRDLPGS